MQRDREGGDDIACLLLYPLGLNYSSCNRVLGCMVSLIKLYLYDKNQGKQKRYCDAWKADPDRVLSSIDSHRSIIMIVDPSAEIHDSSRDTTCADAKGSSPGIPSSNSIGNITRHLCEFGSKQASRTLLVAVSTCSHPKQEMAVKIEAEIDASCGSQGLVIH